ncbi:FAD-binding oxidoreductase [Microbispora sp. RL4-1S]|uniref:FAD-binding oxidoreductase n=1 Tax=Microbispora oryzae TaxID=2806554 RepID=A0A941AHP3_9ACTN|nr:FAD-dependent oxidoreductase [Microbispora oryzae]MBP2702942.1 FAD-binding oxidoreductase [Microbispora oryzae]
MTEAVSADVAVVGNGVIGYSIAIEISRRSPDTRVAVIGPPARPGGASVAAGAMLNCFGEVTKNTLSHPAGRAKLELCRDALDAWPEWLGMLADDAADPDLPGYFRPGTFIALNAKSGRLDEDNFQATIAALDEYGEPYEEVDPRTIPGLDPVPDARPLRALHLPREGAIDARRVLAALERAAERQGVITVPVVATGVDTAGGRASGVRLSDGTSVAAGTVVVAAGAFTGRFLDVLPPGSVPAMLAGTGISLEVRRHRPPHFDQVVRTPNRSGSCGLHIVPLSNGSEYIGATNIVHREPLREASFGMSHFLIQCAREQLDHKLFSADVIRWMVGNRPVPVDGFPLIGPTSIGGLVVAAGTYRDGFHCSPALARHVAASILSEGGETGLEMFRPERPLIQTMSVDESIAEFAYHGVCGAFEGGLELPFWIGPEALQPVYAHAAQQFYAQMESPVSLPPEILMHVTLNATSEEDTESVLAFVKASHAFHG